MTGGSELPESGWVDGVPVHWGDRRGPLRASLTFRSGVADEAFSELGRTHLAVHLAMASAGLPAHGVGSGVGLLTTRLCAEGSEDAVVTFLETACRALTAFDGERLSREKERLRLEAEQWSPSDADVLTLVRFGVRGPGKLLLPELGVKAVTADAMSAWTCERLVRESAVLTLSGPPPVGLSLPLAGGVRRQVAPAVSTLPAGRSAVVGRTSGVALAAQLPRTPATRALELLLGSLLRRDLADGSCGFDPYVTSTPLDASTTHFVLGAACLPQDEPALVRILLGSIERLAAGGGPDEPLEGALADAARERSPMSDRVAESLWGDESPHTPGEANRALVEFTARTLLDTGLLGAQREESVPDRWPVLQADHEAALSGETLGEWADGVVGKRLRITAVGLEVLAGPDAHDWDRSSAVWESCAGVVAYDDGYRQIVREDGSTLEVAPAVWLESEGLADAVDRHLPHLIAPQGKREWLSAVEHAHADVLTARRGTAAAVARRDEARRRFLRTSGTLLLVLSALVVGLSLVVWGLWTAVGGIPATAALVLVVGFLYGGYRAHRGDQREA